VVVVGTNNSAADTATTLLGIADKIYFSHRGGSPIVCLLKETKSLFSLF
jgi:cation diffusion facilitator CzcD-associated flavoprotein CzcO